jgi:hypothetical protein
MRRLADGITRAWVADPRERKGAVLSRVFAFFALAFVFVCTLGAGYAVAESESGASPVGPTQAQYDASAGGSSPPPLPEAEDSGAGDDGAEVEPAATRASASASASASARPGAETESEPAPAPVDPGSEAGAEEGAAPAAPTPSEDELGPAGSAGGSGSARASASASASAGGDRPGSDAVEPDPDGDVAEGSGVANEGAVEEVASVPPDEGGAPLEEAGPDDGAAEPPVPSTEPPPRKDPFDGFSYEAFNEYEAWRARPCGEDNCGLQDVPPSWECYTYKKTVLGDVVYACGVPRSSATKDPKIHVYDENGDLVYEGSVSEDWKGYREQECGPDNCDAPKVPEGWGCREEYQKDAPGRKTEEYIRCFHPLVGEQDITTIPSKYCTYTYDAEGNLLSKYRCTPPSGGMMGDGAGDDAHDADEGLESGNGGGPGGPDGDDDGLGALRGIVSVVAGSQTPPRVADSGGSPVPDSSQPMAKNTASPSGAASGAEPSSTPGGDAKGSAALEEGVDTADGVAGVEGLAVPPFLSDGAAEGDLGPDVAAGGSEPRDRGRAFAGVAGTSGMVPFVDDAGRWRELATGETADLAGEDARVTANGNPAGLADPQDEQEDGRAGPQNEQGGRAGEAESAADAPGRGAERVASAARGVSWPGWSLPLGAGVLLVGGLAARMGLRGRGVRLHQRG